LTAITCTRKPDSILVENAFWQVRHNLKAGGCWDSIRFKNGSGENLLAGPMGSRLRILQPHPASDAGSPFFYEEQNERRPRVTVEETPSGLVVTTEGTYRLASPPPAGEDVPEVLPIRWRRRCEYRPWGQVAFELEIIADEERRDVVEVCALEATLRPGMTDVYWREHPTAMTTSDLTGMGAWHAIREGWRGLSHRYVPIHVVVFEKGVEGLEFFPASDLSPWDTGASAEPGMGYYCVAPGWSDPKTTVLGIAPYCIVYRRNPTRLAGSKTFRYSIGLPHVKKATAAAAPHFHVGTCGYWPSDADLERHARAGVKLVRWHDDGPKEVFWRDGLYPPYDAAHMEHMRHAIDTCHRLGMKIVPYISVKEFHPESPGFRENRPAWQREAGPAFKELHTWYYAGEFGQLMCLESGWLEFRKKSIEIILADLPWDGLYFDWATPHPCRHPGHLGGALHTDQDAFLEFMAWCRARVGPDGIILTHLSGLPQIVIENLSDLALIYEDLAGASHPKDPLSFPAQCRFMPIVPRYLCPWGEAGKPSARECFMVCLLQGTPPIVPTTEATGLSAEMVEEFAKFGREDFTRYEFLPASDRPVETGQDRVFAALWFRKGEALLYVGNLAAKPAKGSLRFDPKRLGLRPRAKVKLSVRQLGGRGKGSQVSSTSLAKRGIPYALRKWASAVIKIEIGE